MDKYIEKAINRLETAAIIPFLHLHPKLYVIIHGNEKTHQSDYSYLKQLVASAKKYDCPIEIKKCNTVIAATDALIALRDRFDISGVMIISDYGSATRSLYDMIPQRMDIGGLSTNSIGTLYGSTDPIAYRHAPSTATAAMKILEEVLNDANETIEGKSIAIIGRSIRVGRPLAEILLQQNASVMMFHSKSPTPINKFDDFDVVISAMGKPKYVDASRINPQGKILIDVGINIDENGKLCGDFDYENFKPYAKYISPVPGGVGPMTTTCTFAKLFANKENYFSDIGPRA